MTRPKPMTYAELGVERYLAATVVAEKILDALVAKDAAMAYVKAIKLIEDVGCEMALMAMRSARADTVLFRSERERFAALMGTLFDQEWDDDWER